MEERQTVQLPKEKDTITHNDLQSNTQKTKDRATRTPLKIGGKIVSYLYIPDFSGLNIGGWIMIRCFFLLMVFNATFNNISLD